MKVQKQPYIVDGPMRWAIGLAIAAMLITLGYAAGLSSSFGASADSGDRSDTAATAAY